MNQEKERENWNERAFVRVCTRGESEMMMVHGVARWFVEKVSGSQRH
jgi:hypothetical protein